MDNNVEMSVEQQKAYENAFKKHNEQLFFTSKEYMLGIADKASFMNEIDNQGIFEKFQFIGTLTYFIGLDFMTTMYANKNVIEGMWQRMKECVFGEEELDKVAFFKKYFSVVREMTKNKEEFEQLYKDYIAVVDETIPSNLYNQMQSIMIHFKRMLNNSFTSVGYVVSINEFVWKKPSELTYRDILKINSTINEYLTFNGPIPLDEFRAMYTNQAFKKILSEAMIRFDRIKFGTVFNESMKTMMDLLLSNRYGSDEEGENNVVEILAGNFTEEQFNAAEEEHKIKVEEAKKQAEENKQEVKQDLSAMSNEEMNKLMDEDPFNAMLVMFDDMTENSGLPDEETVIKAIENIINDERYFGSLYKFVAHKKGKITEKSTMGNYKFDVNRALELIHNRVEELRASYKKHAEDMCKELINKDTINHLIINVIRTLVIETSEQKQYLISQINDPAIKTYQHLTQMMNLIENCKIRLTEDGIRSYMKLRNTIKEYHGEQLETFEKYDSEFNELSMFMNVENLFKEHIEKTKTENKD